MPAHVLVQVLAQGRLVARQVCCESKKAKNEFYRDEAVLAFPTPTGNQRISDIDEKALYVRAPYSSQPNVKPFLPSAASYPALPAGKLECVSCHNGTDVGLHVYAPTDPNHYGDTTHTASAQTGTVSGLACSTCHSMEMKPEHIAKASS
ncbi:MAG: hypothetical protein HGA51_08750, partial [Demequinaceae bacterium]|nr:hypothetical protein [Demequinaceae bacterium]